MAINRDKVLEAAAKYVEKKKYDKAVIEYRKLVDADPNDARTLLKIGDLQQKQGQHAEAISTYETVGKLYSHQGFALKAIAVYKQIREIISKYVPHLEERYGHITPKLAELYQQLGLTSDALAALDEVATRLQRQQKDQEAIEVFRKIVELDPTNPLPHLRLAEALSRVKDTDGAVFEFKTAASQLAGIGRRDDALKVLERLLHHKPDPEQAKICAELYLSRGQPADGMQALAKLQICFQANPRDFDTLALLARAFNAIGQGAKAIEVQKEMARVAEAAGKNDLFREIVERLLRVAPTDDGVRKLAARSGSAAAAAPPYGGPSLQQQVYGGGAQQQQQANPYASTQMQQEPQRPATAQMQRPANAAAAYQQPMMHDAQQEEAASEPPQQHGAGVHEISEDEMDELSYEEVDADEIVDAQQQAQQPGYGQEQPYDDAGQYTEPAYSSEEAYADGNANLGGAVVGSGHPHHAPAEDPGVTEPGEAAEVVEKALADANAFRRVRLYTKALETLRIGLEVDPRSMDLHEVYRDILIESGQTEEAVQEMLVIASLYVDALDGESAARALQDVLAFDPQNARAIEMLQELGYEIVDESEDAQAEVAPGEEQNAYAEQPAEEQPDGRLPSYDLEEMRPADVGAQYADDRQIHVRGQSQPPSAYAEESGGDALPSFPLDEPEQQQQQYEQAETYEEAEPYEEQPLAAATVPPDRPVESARPLDPSATRELEDALDEAEFFCSRGLFEDARAILTEQQARHPKNPLLRERIAEIDAQEQARGSGARERPKDQANGGGDRSFDIAASLDALESLDYGEPMPAEGFAEPDQQVDVEEVFAKFKEGVAKQISVDDSDSHYNLGIAYKEMMLLDDAIREFDTAARDPKRECVCRSMIGMIYIERGNLNDAIDAFVLGLNAAIKDPQQETVLCYEIGAAHEAKKNFKEALSYYQKAMRRDPNYRDVQERVRRLAKNEPKQAPRQAAVGADDEFDRAFDDLLGKA